MTNATTSFTPRYTNLVQILDQSAQRFGHKPLFGTRKADGWQWTTYNEFQRLVGAAASALQRMGVGPGDRVAVISNNRLEWAIFAYGTYSLGAAYVPTYESQSTDEWAFILQDSGAKVCFVANAMIRDQIAAVREQIPNLQHVICFDCGEAESLLGEGAGHPINLQVPSDDTVASLIYTSGTTGKPKGVMLTHFNLASNASACLEISPASGEERSLAFLPWAHVFGGALELNSQIAYGASMAICEDTSHLLEYLPEVQPTMLFAVPRIWNRVYDGVRKQVSDKPKAVQQIFDRGMIAKSKKRRGETLSLSEKVVLALAEKLVFSKIVARFGGRLKFAFSGAAALSAEVAQFVDNLGITVLEGYGLTETSAGTTGSTLADRRFGAVGKPFPGVVIKIAEGVGGARPGEGEIIVYGQGVMKGYYNLPEVTREAFTADGGFRTGDLGRIDGDGFLYITGRVKELFKLENGKYVAPAPLEEKLQLSSYIAQAVIFGADRPYTVALIVPDMATLRSWAASEGIETHDATLVEAPRVRELLRSEIETHSRDFKGYESVRDFVVDTEELSIANGMLTPTLKVKRRKVMEKYGKQLASLYH